MRSRVISTGSVVSVLVLATAAVAQQRGGSRPPQTPSSFPPTASAGVASAAPGDAGAIPPAAPPPEWIGGSKLSPLNPAPNEFSDAGMVPPPIDYERLLSELAALRTRAAALSDVLFHSRLAITLETSGEHARTANLSLALDDGVVWNASASFRAEDAATVYDHAVAPGQHAVTIEVDRRDDRDDAFRSSQKSRFIVEVPADGRLSMDIRLIDDSTIGGDFRSDRKGKYDLRLVAMTKARPLQPGK
jgi:hypothetical protein